MSNTNTITSQRSGQREVLLNVYGGDGTSLLGTIPGRADETLGDVFGRARGELGFAADGPVCLSRRAGGRTRADWESVPENAVLDDLAPEQMDQVDIAVDEDAQLG